MANHLVTVGGTAVFFSQETITNALRPSNSTGSEKSPTELFTQISPSSACFVLILFYVLFDVAYGVSRLALLQLCRVFFKEGSLIEEFAITLALESRVHYVEDAFERLRRRLSCAPATRVVKGSPFSCALFASDLWLRRASSSPLTTSFQ